MNRLTRRNKNEKARCENSSRCFGGCETCEQHWDIIEKLAYYEDLEEKGKISKIVRCKDCDVPHNKYTGCPKLGGLVTPPDFYCAFGMKKTTEDIL